MLGGGIFSRGSEYSDTSWRVQWSVVSPGCSETLVASQAINPDTLHRFMQGEPAPSHIHVEHLGAAIELATQQPALFGEDSGAGGEGDDYAPTPDDERVSQWAFNFSHDKAVDVER